MNEGRQALVAAALLSCAQTPPPAAPMGATMTLKDARRLVRNSNEFSRVLVSSVRWREPVPQRCAAMRERLVATADPMPEPVDPQAPAGAQPFGPAGLTGEALRERMVYETIQRAEENCLTRHAILTEVIWEAVTAGCLQPPPG